jgi:cytochrome c peroxidase
MLDRDFQFLIRASITTVFIIIALSAGERQAVGTVGPASRPHTPAAAPRRTVGETSRLAALGQRIFFDASLSASGRMSCATCHNPAYAYGPPNALAVQYGGPNLDKPGLRAVPSLRYVLNHTPIWSKPFVANPVERFIDATEPPVGGFGWDGRFNSLHEQAAFPLLAPNEMANTGPAAVADKLRRAPYADEFRHVFGPRVFNHPGRAYTDALLALERFELEDPSFHPYTSKYDDYLDGKAQLSAQELRGLALFDDPQRGNCASCHIDRKGADGSHPLFTDYQFQALGVPRNQEIQANASSDYFDQGLCGPLRTDESGQSNYCGMFKTPSLRNVATRQVFFHNGRYHTLKDALRFYVRRDTDPQLWYPAAKVGAACRFNDMPRPACGNVDVTDEPLNRRAGDAPAWAEADIEAVIAFLQTLTDRDVNPR